MLMTLITIIEIVMILVGECCETAIIVEKLFPRCHEYLLIRETEVFVTALILIHAPQPYRDGPYIHSREIHRQSGIHRRLGIVKKKKRGKKKQRETKTD